MDTASLDALLTPRTIAVVGASQREDRPGAVLLNNLVNGGFPGTIYPVNPRVAEIAGLRCYSSLSEVPSVVDLAFIVLPRHSVLPTIQECVDVGVRAVAIITAGFGEADDWGCDQQAAIATLLDEHDIAAIGPNTIGLVAMGGKLRGSFVRFPIWEDGPVAIAAQSGVFAGSLAEQEMARPAGRLGMHMSISLGNRVGTDETALLRYCDANDAIDVIGLYLESFREPMRFLECATDVKRRKPIVLLKSGRTPSGAAAAASHTGSLAVDDAVLDDLLYQHGVIRVHDDEEFLATLRSLCVPSRPAGRRVGVVTFSGAFGVIASDLLTETDLKLADYSGQTLARFASLLPEWQHPRNPADLWPAVDLGAREALLQGLEAALCDPSVDQVLAILLAVPNAHFEDMLAGLSETLDRSPCKPLHVYIVGGRCAEWTTTFSGLGIPVHPSLRVAVRSMAAVTWYEEVREVSPSAYTRDATTLIEN